MFRYWSSLSNGPFWDKVALVAAATFIAASFALFWYSQRRRRRRDSRPSVVAKRHGS